MSTNPKQLVIERERQQAEKACKIVGTRESLLLLAHDLSTAAQELPEHTTNSQFVYLTDWKQHTLDDSEDGVFFQVEPDLASYLERRRATRSRILPWVHSVLGVIVVALALIGLRAVWLWTF